MTRHVLEVLLGSEWVVHLTYDEFGTFLKEVEAFLNSRHLVSTYDNVTDLNIITPMSLLAPCLPLAHIPDKFVGLCGVRTAYSHVQHLSR